jgi:hypothetical protein
MHTNPHRCVPVEADLHQFQWPTVVMIFPRCAYLGWSPLMWWRHLVSGVGASRKEAVIAVLAPAARGVVDVAAAARHQVHRAPWRVG